VSVNGNDILGSAEGIEVRIRDLSGASGSEPSEVVRGFTSLAHANAFARRYVRDSVERCRAPGMSAEQLCDAWFAFGEDAEVEGAGEGAWQSATELAQFLATRCRDAEERNWRVLDPRNDAGDDDGADEE
jgi:phage tail tape-measure protein